MDLFCDSLGACRSTVFGYNATNYSVYLIDMSRTKDEQLHVQRREDILLAAARTFRRKGFHAARTEDICGESGLSAGTVFRYFSSKREIIFEIATREYAHYQAQIRLLATREGILWLSCLDEAGLNELLAPSQYDLGSESWLELLRDPEWRERIISFEAELRTTLTEAFLTGQREGWIHPALPCEGAAHLLCALMGGLVIDREIGLTEGQAAIAKTLSRLFRIYFLA